MIIFAIKISENNLRLNDYNETITTEHRALVAVTVIEVVVVVNAITWRFLVNTLRDLDQLRLRLEALGVSGHLVLAGSQQSEVVTILN